MTSDRLRIARLVAASAGAVAASFHRRPGLADWRKDDGSVVTEADVATEEHVRERLGVLDPGTAVAGEELGDAPADRGRWIVDPIDGTENFRRGSPFWGILLAWCGAADGVDTAVVTAPALGRSWWAERGSGAFTDGVGRITVSRVADLAQSSFCFGGAHEYPRGEAARLAAFAAQCRVAWGIGNFLGHMQVAEGIADAALSYDARIWDLAAPSLIVSEAGGVWSDLAGRADLTSGTMLTTNRPLNTVFLQGLEQVALSVPGQAGA
jgi:histidinol-phosphatase